MVDKTMPTEIQEILERHAANIREQYGKVIRDREDKLRALRRACGEIADTVGTVQRRLATHDDRLSDARLRKAVSRLLDIAAGDDGAP